MNHSRWEIFAVLLTGLGNFVLADWLGLRLAFVVGACLFWMGFVAIRASADASVLGEWGLTTRNLGRSLGLLAPVAALAVTYYSAALELIPLKTAMELTYSMAVQVMMNYPEASV